MEGVEQGEGGTEVTEPGAAGYRGRRWLILAGLPMESSSWPVRAMGRAAEQISVCITVYFTCLCQENRAELRTTCLRAESSLSCKGPIIERGRTCIPKSLS